MRLVFDKIVKPDLLPARFGNAFEPVLIDRGIVADVDRRRCALDHKQLLGRHGKFWNALHAGSTGADNRDGFVGELFHARPFRATTGILIIPATGMK
ncbi:MAG: Uncharacterised protein [Hyphomonas sp. TMED17]|nr:MAG: Uncharacterised protein [Hyphomonas sp. TMED17]